MENTKKFTIELLIYNNIYDNENKSLTDSTTEKNEFIDSERINLELPIYYTEDKKNSFNEYYIRISDLKMQLKKKGYPITTSKLFIHINNINDYVFINDDKEIFYSSMLSKNNTIKLKLNNYLDNRLIKDTFLLLKKHFSDIHPQNSEKKIEKESPPNTIKNIINFEEKNTEVNKRTRKIGEIVKNVYAQRMLFNGFYNDEGVKEKYDLQAASDKIGIPKKTLDDYLKQIRTAREFGFNFNKNKNEPISVLRKFNKDMLSEYKKTKKLNDDTNINNNINININLEEEDI